MIKKLAVGLLSWRPLSFAVFWLAMSLLAFAIMAPVGSLGTPESNFAFIVAAGASAAYSWLGALAWPVGLYWLARDGQPRRWIDVVPYVASIGLPVLLVGTAARTVSGIPTNVVFEVATVVVLLSIFVTFALAADALVQFERTFSSPKANERFWTFVQIFYLPIGVFLLRLRVDRLLIARGIEAKE